MGLGPCHGIYWATSTSAPHVTTLWSNCSLIYDIYHIHATHCTSDIIYNTPIYQFDFLYYNYQDIGQTVLNIIFSLNEPNFPYTSLTCFTDSMIIYPKFFLQHFLMGNRTPLVHTLVLPKHNVRP